jgi:hypothetical protein
MKKETPAMSHDLELRLKLIHTNSIRKLPHGSNSILLSQKLTKLTSAKRLS